MGLDLCYVFLLVSKGLLPFVASGSANKVLRE